MPINAVIELNIQGHSFTKKTKFPFLPIQGMRLEMKTGPKSQYLAPIADVIWQEAKEVLIVRIDSAISSPDFLAIFQKEESGWKKGFGFES